MLDFVWSLDPLAAEPSVHLLLGHLSLNQAFVEDLELQVVL
jgi:hypothetical protein